VIELPDGWVDRTAVTYVGPDAGDGSPSLVITREQVAGDLSLGRWAAMHDAAIRVGFEGIELLDDRETTAAGLPAVRHTYRWTLEGKTMRQRVWCIVDGGTGYAIVATAPDGEFEQLRPVWARAVASFSPR